MPIEQATRADDNELVVVLERIFWSIGIEQEEIAVVEAESTRCRHAGVYRSRDGNELSNVGISPRWRCVRRRRQGALTSPCSLR
jgi:hypothetical protein